MSTLSHPPILEEGPAQTLVQLALEQATNIPKDSTTVHLPLGKETVPAVVDPYNERLKLYELSGSTLLEGLAATPNEAAFPSVSPSTINKVTAYALPGDEALWSGLGFEHEAVIEGFYQGGQDAHLWAAYSEAERAESTRELDHRLGVTVAQGKAPLAEPALADNFSSRLANSEDAPAIADLLQQTFEDYPSPIEDQLIAHQIETQNNAFRVVLDSSGELAAAASAELDHERAAAEMTDCATRLDYRGHGLMAYLLHRLERDIAERFAITDLYTIARADEIAMNCVFSKLGYRFTGRLRNNCRMPNGWESMNVWCKNPRQRAFALN